MSNVIRSLMVTLGIDLSKMQKGLAQAGRDFTVLGKHLKNVGGAMTRGLTLPILAAKAALAAIVVESAESASSLVRMSAVTGLSTDRLQELTYIGTKLGVALESITGSQRSLVKAMSAAQAGTKDQADGFKALGVSVVDGTGHLRDSNVVFGEAIDALGRMKNPAERDALALKLFGKNALALNPLIKAGGAELASLTAAAHENGAVLGGSSVVALGAFADNMKLAKQSLGVAASEIAMALMPVLQQLLPVIRDDIIPAIRKLAGFISGLVTWFKNASPGMRGFVLALLGIAVSIGPVLSSIGELYVGFGSLSTILSKITLKSIATAGSFLFLIASIGLLIGVISALPQAQNELSGATGTAKDLGDATTGAASGADSLASGLDDVTSSAKGLLGLSGLDEINKLGSAAAASPVDVDSALTDLSTLQESLDNLKMPEFGTGNLLDSLGLSGIQKFFVDWDKFWMGVGAGIYDFFAAWDRDFQKVGADLFDLLAAAWNGIVIAWNAVWGALKIAWNAVCGAVKTAWYAVVGALKIAWDAVCGALKIAWNAVVGALKTAWDAVCGALKTAWNAVVGAIKTAWDAVGRALTTAWDAIKTAWGAVWTALTTAWTGFTSGIKGVWDGIGKGIRDGLNIGIDAINMFLVALNKLKITLPSIMGGGTIGFNIPLIPRLAQGGILDTPTLAMVGEQGREAVLPLDRNTGWMDELAGRLASVMGTGQPAYAGSGDVSVYIGNEKLDSYITRATARQALRSNGR